MLQREVNSMTMDSRAPCRDEGVQGKEKVQTMALLRHIGGHHVMLNGVGLSRLIIIGQLPPLTKVARY